MSGRPGYRWTLLAAVWGLYVGFGLVATSLAPLVGVISDDLGVGRGQMGAVLGAWQLMYLGAAVPAGRVLTRFGIRWGLAVGIGLIVVSGLARATVGGWPTLFAAVAVFGLGGPLISIGTPALVSQWFEGDERGPATGMAMSGPVVGSVLSLLLTNSVLMPLTGDRWRLVVALHAVAAAVAGVVWVIVTTVPPAAGRAGRAGRWHPPATDRTGRTPELALLRVPLMQLVLVLAIGTFFINHALANWLPEMLGSAGLSPSAAGAWAAVPSLLGLAGGIVVPRLAVAERRRVALAACYGLLAVGLVGLIGDWSTVTIVGLVTIGFLRSALMPVALSFLMDSPDVGPGNMATAGGLYFTAGEIGGVTGPLTVGLLAGSGGFTSAQVALVGVSATLGLLVAVSPALSSQVMARRPAAH